MRLSELLHLIAETAQATGLSEPYLVGGVPRDKVLSKLHKFNDLDLTTGDSGIHYLAKEVSLALQPQPFSYQKLSDGHARILLGDLKLDFSSNFNVPNIEKLLAKLQIHQPNEMEKELYSRDFTCNTLLLSLDLKRIEDHTRRAMHDIQNKVLQTCLPPEITLGSDPKRVVRAIYLAAKLEFVLSNEVRTWIQNNPGALVAPGSGYVTKKLTKAFSYNSKITRDLLQELNLMPYLPPSSELAPFL